MSSKARTKAAPAPHEIAPRGRPRSGDVHRRILDAAYALLMDKGYPALTMEAVAARAKVGKPTVYLRWSGKAQLALDAVLSTMNEQIRFPEASSLRDGLRSQMTALAELMNSPQGRIIATIIGGGQNDPQLLRAYRENWWAPRRASAREALMEAVDRGELSRTVDIDFAIDLLYSPLFYRLLIGHAPLDRRFVHKLVETVLAGLDYTGAVRLPAGRRKPFVTPMSKAAGRP